MAEPAGELPPLPPVASEPLATPEPPANPDPPAEPLAVLAVQPAAPNPVISSFWCISFVLSFSYPLYDAFRVFSLTFGSFGFFLQVLGADHLTLEGEGCG